MRTFKSLLFSILAFGLCQNASAQKKHPLLVCKYSPSQGFKHFITKTPWIIQLGGNVVDDDGKPFRQFFDVNKTWNVPPYPTKLAVEKELKYNWSIELAFTYNNFKKGKTVNNDVLKANSTFLAVDLNGKWIVTKLFRVEPYLLAGFGYTMRSPSKYPGIATFNAGFGFNIWAIDNVLGLSIQGTGKFGLLNPVLQTSSNYLQHSLGILYKFSGNHKKLMAARKNIKRIYTK